MSNTGQQADFADHVEGRLYRPGCRVAVHFVHAEESDDLVADQLLDSSLVAEDHVDHGVEVLVQQVDDHGCRRGLGEAGEPLDVGEEHGGLPPVAGQLQQRGVGQRQIDEPGRDVAL